MLHDGTFFETLQIVYHDKMENFADYIDGFMTGAVKYKPYVLLSATSLNGELTVSMCVREMKKTKL